MNIRTFTQFFICTAIVFVCSNVFASNVYDSSHSLFENDEYVFLPAESRLLVFSKDVFQWFVFEMNSPVKEAKALGDDSFLLNDEEVCFSEFKSLLLDKKTNRAKQGMRILDFEMRSTNELVENDRWVVKVFGDDVVVEHRWSLYNVKQEFKFRASEEP